MKKCQNISTSKGIDAQKFLVALYELAAKKQGAELKVISIEKKEVVQ